MNDDAVIAFIRSEPQVARKLHLEHDRDPFGRCAKCTVNGVKQTRYPCTLAMYAAEALAIPLKDGGR